MWQQVLSRIALILAGILIISFWLPILLWLFVIFASVFAIMLIISLFTDKTSVRVIKMTSKPQPQNPYKRSHTKVIDITEDQEKK
ncbi:hypothetical protein SAMN02745150_00770 [Brevinema andersonii]|uniref:Uncharacterized protein n=1 Tax=Brevinema andersonii TaxID=34097 RepID=A0A1I1DTQ2_BREAD|nr:hypothetical protein [Brevinema andersonii]SFB78244.1 hypothetical protein SAMN02745150_00770 [Brevinema andersonii]